MWGALGHKTDNTHARRWGLPQQQRNVGTNMWPDPISSLILNWKTKLAANRERGRSSYTVTLRSVTWLTRLIRHTRPVAFSFNTTRYAYSGRRIRRNLKKFASKQVCILNLLLFIPDIQLYQDSCLNYVISVFPSERKQSFKKVFGYSVCSAQLQHKAHVMDVNYIEMDSRICVIATHVDYVVQFQSNYR